MSPADFRASLQALGLTYLTAAEALRMGKWGYQTVGKWARGEAPIPGPAQVAVELMVAQRRI